MMVYSGLWNPKDFTNRKREAYEFYSRIREVITAWCILSRVVAGILLFIGTNWKALMNNLLITLVIIIVPAKYYLCRSEAMYDILVDTEKLQYNWLYANIKAKEVYNLYKRQSLKYSLAYLIYAFISALTIIIATLVVAEIKAKEGETDVDIPLFSYWTPYDKNKYKFITYGLDFFALINLAAFYCVADLLILGLISFGIANFKVLQHNLKCSKTYIEVIKMERGISRRDAEMIFIKDNIMHHRNAIRFLEKVDKQIATFVIFDFSSISIKLSILIYQTLNELTMFLEYVILFALISTISIELFAYYWFGNEIQLQSGYLTRQAIFDSNFDEFTPETRRRLAFMIQRAQRPCQISIGSIYAMNIETLIKVLKAVYTYICLFNKVNEEKNTND